MAMTAKQFLDRERTDNNAMPKCVVCGCVLHETSTGNRWTEKGCTCSDCYFDTLSEVVERNPIRTARIRRG